MLRLILPINLRYSISSQKLYHGIKMYININYFTTPKELPIDRLVLYYFILGN